jgi:hypothetical protein
VNKFIAPAHAAKTRWTHSHRLAAGAGVRVAAADGWQNESPAAYANQEQVRHLLRGNVLRVIFFASILCPFIERITLFIQESICWSLYWRR